MLTGEFFKTVTIIVIGLPLLLALMVLLIIAVLIFIKWVEWKMEVLAVRRAYLKEHFRPDGTPYPPFGRGMCDRCAQVFDKVYYIPDRRLCPACYDAEFPS